MSYASTVLADSPAGFWRLDETSGTSAADAAGTNTGTYVGSYTLNQAGAGVATGTSVAFTAGYISVPNAAAIQFSGNLTFEAWFKTSATSDQMIVAKYTPSGAFPGYAFRVSSAGKVGVYVGDGVYQETTLSYNNGAWHHAVFTLTGTSGVIYIDGASVSTVTRTPSMSTTQSLTIATDPGHGLNFIGNLDEVAVYGSALSSGRVSAHFAAASATGGPLLRRLIGSVSD